MQHDPTDAAVMPLPSAAAATTTRRRPDPTDQADPATCRTLSAVLVPLTPSYMAEIRALLADAPATPATDAPPHVWPPHRPTGAAWEG